MPGFPIIPIGAGGSGSGEIPIGVPILPTIPPPVVVTGPAPPPCTAAQLWVPLETLCQIAVAPSFDPPTYGSEYADGIFTCVHSDNQFGEWLVDTTGHDAPIMCCLQIVSGALLNNISYLIAGSSYVYLGVGPGYFTPFFLLTPNTADQQLQFYEYNDTGAEHLATPVTFKVIAFPLTTPS
jgi:hypothetical protein